jgi:hypothetical protein
MAARGFQLGVTGCAVAGLPVNSVGSDGDGEWTVGTFFEERAVGFLLVLDGIGVKELHIAGAKDFEAIVKVRSGCQGLGSEAGAWVIDFNQE